MVGQSRLREFQYRRQLDAGHGADRHRFFGVSNQNNVSFSANTTFGGWTFSAGASNYVFTITNFLTFNGAGIVINGGSATITNNFLLRFFDSSTAGSATITNNSNSLLSFFDSSTAGSATITNNGFLEFIGNSTGGTARLITGTTGTIDLSGLSASGMTAGSIEGGGTISLGSKNLTVGSNNLSTEFGGEIEDGGESGGTGGSLTKVGSGTLTLSGINTYTGTTTMPACWSWTGRSRHRASLP